MEDVAFDAGGAVEPHPVGADRTLDPAGYRQVFGDHITFDLGAIGNQHIGGVQLAFDAAKNLDRPCTGNLAGDCHAGADRRNAIGRFRSGRWRGRGAVEVLYRRWRFKLLRHAVLTLSKHVHTPSPSVAPLKTQASCRVVNAVKAAAEAAQNLTPGRSAGRGEIVDGDAIADQ